MLLRFSHFFLTVFTSSSNTSLASSYEQISSMHSLSRLPGTTASKSQLLYNSLRDRNEPADFSSRNTEEHKQISIIMRISYMPQSFNAPSNAFNSVFSQTTRTVQYVLKVKKWQLTTKIS